jgi:hypothetical protein
MPRKPPERAKSDKKRAKSDIHPFSHTPATHLLRGLITDSTSLPPPGIDLASVTPPLHKFKRRYPKVILKTFPKSAHILETRNQGKRFDVASLG